MNPSNEDHTSQEKDSSPEQQTPPEKRSQERSLKIKAGPIELEGPLELTIAVLLGLLLGFGAALFAVGQYRQPSFVVEPLINHAIAETATAQAKLTQTLTPSAVPSPISTTPETPPAVSLFNLSYQVDNWDPRLVDLRKAATSGIPVRSGSLLQFHDLWLSVARDAPECRVWAEIYDDPQLTNLVGVVKEPVPLRAGRVALGDVEILKFSDGSATESWRVQPDWTDLGIALVAACGEKVFVPEVTTIHLDANGTAWLLDPPYASFVSIVYAVNGGPAHTLDLRETTESGLSAGPGDEITLPEIWYRVYAEGDDVSTIRAEAHLSSDGFDQETYIVTARDVIQQGTHKLTDSTALRWVVPDGRKTLFLFLVSDDGSIMDGLDIPLAPQ